MRKLLFLFIFLFVTISIFGQNTIEESSYVRQGRRFFDRRDYVSAISCFTDAVYENERDVDAFFYRGITYYAMGNYNEAINDFNKLLRMNEIKAYQIYDAWMYRSKSYMKIGNYEKAIDDFTSIITFTMRNVVEAEFHDYEGIELYKELLNEILEDAYFNRGLCHVRIRMYQNAIYDYTIAINYNSENSIYFSNRGAAYSEVKDYENAERDLKKSLLLDPNQFEANHNLGIVYKDLEKYRDAVMVLTRAIEFNNNSASTYYWRGVAYYNLNDHRKAINDIETAVRINPNNSHYRDALNMIRDVFYY